jgi:hypothetical protein
MKKTICILTSILSILFCVVPLQAQEVKKSVLSVYAFQYASSFGEADVVTVRNKIIATIQETGRVAVVDNSSLTANALTNEAERRKQETAMNDAGRVADISTLDANFILTGTLGSLTVTRSDVQTKDGRTLVSYDSKINYTLSIINPANGTVVSQKTFDESAYGSTEVEAKNAVLTNVGGT